MPEKRSRIITALSWGAVAGGLLFGIVTLAFFGAEWIPDTHGSGWLLRWYTYVGTGQLGLSFVLGSMAAPSNRKRAGLIFLALLPLTAFCLAYPEAGYMVGRPDGGYFEAAPPLAAIGLTVLFFAPFLAPLLALRHKKRALILFVIAASGAAVVFSTSHWTKVLVPRLAAWSALFLVFALFWLVTDRRGWAPLIAPRFRSVRRRVATFAVTCALLIGADVAAVLGLSALGSSLFTPDCAGGRLFARPIHPGHAVFTARIVLTGRSIEARTRPSFERDRPSEPVDPRLGDWAIGVVQEQFWGLPSWARVVLLTNHLYWKDETYLIDGERGSGLLTRLLPIVEAGVCSRTSPLSNATVTLRVLRNPQWAGGNRLLGYVHKPEQFVSFFQAPPLPPKPFVGAEIILTGPTGTRTVTTDKGGIYEVSNVPPGDYTVQLRLPDNRLASPHDDEKSADKVHLDHDSLSERNFDLFWNGRIAGCVKDDSGKPAHIWVALESADSGSPRRGVDFQLSARDGTYQMAGVAPGRYVVLVDPSGPDDRWPYDIQYYRSALRAKDALVLQLTEGQKIKGIDFTVHRLAQRSIQVHVTWPNGSPAVRASVCLAYEHTANYESLTCTGPNTDTNKDGFAVIHAYGSSRVRLFASQHVDVNTKKWWDTYYSKRVESEADKMPEQVTLVLESPPR